MRLALFALAAALTVAGCGDESAPKSRQVCWICPFPSPQITDACTVVSCDAGFGTETPDAGAGTMTPR